MPDTSLLKNRLHGLYVITDEKLIPEKQFHLTIEQVLLGGAGIIQYRDKSGDLEKRKQQATLLRALSNQHGALLIINDDIQLARLVSADGVHLGENDGTIETARTLLGDNAIIGVSCYNQIELAIKAEKESADYVAFGAFFPSPTKPSARVAELDLLGEAKTRLDIPVCAIGGINLTNAKQVFDAGADMVAVINSVFGQVDTKQASQNLAKLF